MRIWPLLLALAGPAQAVELQLPPGARMTAERNTGPDRYAAPTGVLADQTVPMVAVDGAVARAAWRIDTGGLTSLQVMTPLRAQLEAAGYRIVLDCAAAACGGYDFRFAIEVLPGPNMYVNIRDYHVMTALRGPEDAPEAVVSLLASVTDGAAFLQVIDVNQQDAAATPEADVPPDDDVTGDVTPDTIQAPAQDMAQALAQTLARDGHVALAGLDFDVGTSSLGAGPSPSLAALAELLRAQPDVRVALVGHTDNAGTLEINAALSRDRARAVRTRLIEGYGIAPERLDAAGVGYLAPLTTNATSQGREENRRVEVVLLAQ